MPLETPSSRVSLFRQNCAPIWGDGGCRRVDLGGDVPRSLEAIRSALAAP